jgi:hypothetical protein
MCDGMPASGRSGPANSSESTADENVPVPGPLLAKSSYFMRCRRKAPSAVQLGQYANRIAKRSGGMLVTLSQASQALAASSLPAQVDGVPVVHLPWRDVLADIAAVRSGCRGRERVWLDELHAYLRG